MHALARASRLARVVRPLRRPLTTQAVEALDALRVVHKAARDGRDAEYSLQVALWGKPLVHAFELTAEEIAEEVEYDDTEYDNAEEIDAVEAEQEAEQVQVQVQEPETEPEPEPEPLSEEELVAAQRAESPISVVCPRVYPRLASHGLLHEYLRQERVLAAAGLVLEQLEQGVAFKTRSIEELLDALCPPHSTLPGRPFTPTVRLGSRDVVADGVERLTRDVDLGTALAVAILNAARETASPRTSDMYRRVFSAIIVQQRMTLAASVYAQLVRDWHLHTWLTGPTPPPVPAEEEPDESEEQQPNEMEEEVQKTEEDEFNVTTEAEAMLQELYKPDDIADAHAMRLDDPTFPLPPPKSSHLARIVGHILRPESVDMKRPSRRFTVPPTWEKDNIVAAFLLLELVERRQLDVPDIAGVVRVAAAVPRTPTFPMRLFRGGQLRRVKPHAHLENVLRGLLREEPAPRFAGTAACPPDMLRPLSVQAYNELLSFGLARGVPHFEMEALVDAMVAQGVRPDKETYDALFRRSKLAQNKLVSVLLEKLKVLEEQAADAQNISS